MKINKLDLTNDLAKCEDQAELAIMKIAQKINNELSDYIQIGSENFMFYKTLMQDKPYVSKLFLEGH